MTVRAETKLWLALGFGLLVGLANVLKPVHIDDTLYLEVARRILADPLDPYGGTLNWQQIPERTYNVSISPPLLSYWFALVMAVGGENVPLLHLSMLPWALMACWAVFRLGERWAGAGLSTVLLVIGGPAVTAGMNLMLDVPLLACVCASIEFVARSDDGRRPAVSLVVAAALAAVGVWIKFAALGVVPVFLAVALARRRVGPLLAGLAPLAALAGWQWVSRSLYGTSQVGAGMSFLAKLQSSLLPQTVERTLTMAAILAMTFPIGLAAPWRGRRTLAALLLAVVAAGTTAWLLPTARSTRLPMVDNVFVAAVFIGTFSLTAIATSPARWPEGVTDPRPLLAAWIVSGAAVVILFGPFVAVRSFLPIEPPLAIWLLAGRAATQRRWALDATIVLTLTLGVLLTATDLRWARCYPAAADTIAARFGRAGRPVEFLGHWGWQYYAQRAGFRAWDARRRDAAEGTLIVIPLRADKQWIDPAVLARCRLVDRIVVPASPLRLTTWNRQAGFRFYGGDFGQVPWGLSTEPTERFSIYELTAASQ